MKKLVVETKIERQACGKPVGIDVPYIGYILLFLLFIIYYLYYL